MRFTLNIDDLKLQADCDQLLHRQAERLLKVLGDMHNQGPPLEDGTTIMFGWVLLRLKEIDGSLQVCEPDFFGNSINDYLPHVDCTLQVLEEQARLIHQLNCSSRATLYTDSIVAAKGCFAEHHLYLERGASVKTGDSGWYIGSTERTTVSKDEFEVVYAYQLLALRPELMQVLALPEEYLVVFSGRSIKAIIDAQDKQVWPVSDELIDSNSLI